MAGYTKLNLKQDVEDQAPHYDMSPQLEFRVAREPLETENAAISYLRVAPTAIPKPAEARTLVCGA